MRPFHDEIMEKVDLYAEINLVTGCWDWTGHRNALGYANTSFKGRPWTTTRLIYAAKHGPFDPDLDVCHSCDNPMCVNPEHLRVDTHKNNLLDASRRKRLNGQWKTHCKRGHPLSGDNLYIWAPSGFRQCKKCDLAGMRRKAGWPKEWWYSDVRCPPGMKLDFTTGQFIPAVRQRTGATR